MRWPGWRHVVLYAVFLTLSLPVRRNLTTSIILGI